MNQVEDRFWELHKERVWQDRAAEVHPILSRVPLLGFVYRTALRVRRLGLVWAAQEKFDQALIRQVAYLAAAQSQLQLRWAESQASAPDALPACTAMPNGLLIRADSKQSGDSNIAWEVDAVYFHDVIRPETATLLVDIGAHIGSYSYLVKRANPQARVIAVEPLRENWLMCQANVGFWRDVTVHQAWVRYQPAEAPVMLVHLNSTGSHMILPSEQAQAHLRDNPGAYRLDPDLPPSVTLETLLEGVEGEISILKLDCEGAEQDILTHAPLDTLRRCKWIVGEYHFSRARFEAEILPRLAPFFELLEYVGGSTSELGIFLFRHR